MGRLAELVRTDSLPEHFGYYAGFAKLWQEKGIDTLFRGEDRVKVRFLASFNTSRHLRRLFFKQKSPQTGSSIHHIPCRVTVLAENIVITVTKQQAGSQESFRVRLKALRCKLFQARGNYRSVAENQDEANCSVTTDC